MFESNHLREMLISLRFHLLASLLAERERTAEREAYGYNKHMVFVSQERGRASLGLWRWLDRAR